MNVRELLLTTTLLFVGSGAALADADAAKAAMTEAAIQAMKAATAKEMVAHTTIHDALIPMVEDYLHDLYSDEQVVALAASGLYYHVPDEMQDAPDAAPALVRSYGATLVDEFDRDGVAFLPVEAQRQYLQMQIDILTSMSPENCVDRLLMRQKSDEEMLAVELGVIQEKGLDYAKTWLDLKSAAVKALASATAEGRHARDLLSKDDYATGQRVIETTYMAMADEDPRIEESYAAYNRPEDAAAAPLCVGHLLPDMAALSLDGAIGDIAVKVVSTHDTYF